MALEHFDEATRILGDREIVERVLAGEIELFEILMRRYNQRLYRLARGVLSGRDEVEDVLQDSYVLSFQRLSQFRGESFGPWIAKIVINAGYAKLRSGNRLRVVDDQFILNADSALKDTKDTPESDMHRIEMLQFMETAIKKLPGDFRLVFMLRAVEQLSVQETATYLDIEPATVKTRYHRARSMLKKNLSHKLDAVLDEAFEFGGQRCDRVVRNVFALLAGIASE